MNKLKRFALTLSFALILLGVALIGVSLLTGGSVRRILYTTDIADMTRFFSRERIEAVVDFFFKV